MIKQIIKWYSAGIDINYAIDVWAGRYNANPSDVANYLYENHDLTSAYIK